MCRKFYFFYNFNMLSGICDEYNKFRSDEKRMVSISTASPFYE